MEFKQYRGKSILAWLSYNANYEDPHGGINNRCYVYPRVMNGANYDPIDSTDFPKLGRIEVRIQGGDSADDVYSNFGPLVNIRINGDPYPNYDSNNMYSLKYNPQYGKANSEIWIESFSGKGFYQVIDVNSSIETIQSERSIPEPDCIIRTALILLRCEDKLYGPFECDTKEGMTALHGLKDYQYSVGEYAAMNYNDDLLVIEDQDGEEALILIPKVSVPSPDECEIRYDWISEEVLIDSFVDSLRVENSYTREQVRQLKEMVHQLVESGAGVQFTNDRIAKMQALLQSIGQKEEYVRDVVEYALTDESMKAALTEEVANNYFDRIQSKMLEFSSVQERIDGLKKQEAALQQSVEMLQGSAEHGKAESSEDDQIRISELTQEIEELRKRNEALNEEIGLHKEIKVLTAERDHWKSERDKAKDNYDQQLIDNNELKKQFDATLKLFNDKATQTARILDSKLLDKILRGIGEEPAVEDIVPFDSSLLHAEPMDAVDIIKRVTDFISEKAHRDVTSNDVANYLICITQGFITTFAGEPGTGKTSLCNILAKALGLVTDIPQRRFVDISVERGWSSHKDFIGYYNKLFEYYCLLQLLKLLADNGYHKADIQEPAFKYLYTSADGHYQNEQDVANTYVLSRNHITATLYYQPVISAFNFENGLTLYRTTSKKGYYTPDFVLKFSFSEHDEEYIIFDAKFASRDTIKNFRLPEVIRKYSCELCVAANSRAPKMVWILQGRVNSNEKAIWRYHNSPLVSVCRPATSFGIVSVNTTIEIRQRLWNEIKSNILLLQ